MKKTPTLFILLLAACFFNGAASTDCAAEIIVIANANISENALERSAVSDIYMGNRLKWDNGVTIRVAMLKQGDVHERFAEDIVGTTVAKLKNLWKKVIFTGTGTPPKIFKNESDLVEFVAGTEGAIGYIDSTTSHENVKEITLK